MNLFLRRFLGALALDPNTFEDVESDRHAGVQAAVVVLIACLAGGIAARGMATADTRVEGFIIGTALTLGAWAVWALLINSLGTRLLPEPQTHSDTGELMRTIGFAAAPAVFLAFAAIRPAAPMVFALVAAWIIADAVLAVRQSLDYRSTARAITVCVLASAISAGLLFAIALMLTTPVG